MSKEREKKRRELAYNLLRRLKEEKGKERKEDGKRLLNNLSLVNAQSSFA